MGSVSKTWIVSATVCIIIYCCVTTIANASLLKDVRVGEHKDFTRLVFEFDSVTQYSQPVLKDKDTISVTFLKNKTPYTLTRRNLQRSSRHFNTITFNQLGSDLTASVTVIPPHFKLKAFSLLKPYRVVIDVYWLNVPLRTAVIPPPALQNVKKTAPLSPKETEAKRKKKITALPKLQKREVPAMITPEKITKMPKEAAAPLTKPDQVALPRPLQTTTPGIIQLAQATLQYSRLQVHLIVVLIALNVIIVIIFAFMSWFCLKRIESSKYGENDGIADTFAVQNSTAVSIDNEIRKKFKEYEDL